MSLKNSNSSSSFYSLGNSECLELHDSAFCVDTPLSSFIGKSETALELKRKIVKAAKSDLPVLILGESGCGKSFIARLIHELSIRRLKYFFDENISALPESIVESELFGSVEGAFTGSKNRIGSFEKANGGTLFLDEFGEASLYIQRKFLKVLEKYEFRKLGSSESIKSDVRLIFATNANLNEKMEKGEFRRDLFYRISNIIIQVPPLRERKKDIPLICEDYMKRKSYRKIISDSVMNMICNFDWPGNIRELQHVIDRAVFNAEDNNLILPEHIEIY